MRAVVVDGIRPKLEAKGLLVWPGDAVRWTVHLRMTDGCRI